MRLRQIPIIPLSLAAGCWLDGSRDCSPADAGVFDRAVLDDEFGDDVDVEVCGDGGIWAGTKWELDAHADGRLSLDTDGRVFIDGETPAWGELEIVGFGPFTIGRGPAPAVATSVARLVGELDAREPIDGTAFDLADPYATSDYSAAATVIGPDARRHEVQLFFKRTQDLPQTTWEFWAVGSDPDAGQGAALIELGRGVLRFDPAGGLAAAEGTTVNAPWDGEGGATIALHFGTPIADGGTGLDGMTSQAGRTRITRIDADGADPSPELMIELTSSGEVVTTYADGRERVWGRLLDGLRAELRLSDAP